MEDRRTSLTVSTNVPDPEQDPYVIGPAGSGSKKMKKNLISIFLSHLHDLLSLKNDENVP
jgi:hypothetical protein